MLEKTYFKSMADDDEDKCNLAKTILTCEGNLTDPLFPNKLKFLIYKLKGLVSDEKKPFKVEKVEPWNSVRVTFNIPHDAAERLRQLAERGDRALRDLGILSVQVEGDQVISLTLAARTPEVVLNNRPTADSSDKSTTSRLLNSQSSSSGLYGGGGLRGTDFRSPNVVAPAAKEPIPFAAAAAASSSRLSLSSPSSSGYNRSFPFASMTHAMSTKQKNDSSTLLHSPNSLATSRFSPSTSPSSTAATSQSVVIPRPQNTQTSSVFNNVHVTGKTATVSHSSPLLVNLLQNETTSNKMMPPPAPVNALKRKRKPRKPKDKEAEVSLPFSLSPEVSSFNATINFSSTSSPNISQVPNTSVSQAPHRTSTSPSISPSNGNSGKSSPSSTVTTSSSRVKHLINPITGQLEAMSSEDEEEEDVPTFSGHESSQSKDNHIISYIKADSTISSNLLWDQTSVSSLTVGLDGKGLVNRQDFSGSGDALKLRLKIDPKASKEEEINNTVKRLKLDISSAQVNSNSRPPDNLALLISGGKRSPNKTSPEPRVPPIHISLKGGQANVISPRKDTPSEGDVQDRNKSVSLLSPQRKVIGFGVRTSSGFKVDSTEINKPQPPATDSNKPTSLLWDKSVNKLFSGGGLTSDNKVLNLSPAIETPKVSESSSEIPSYNEAPPDSASSLLFRGVIAAEGGDTPESTSSQEMQEPSSMVPGLSKIMCKDDANSPLDLEEEDKVPERMEFLGHQLETPPDSGGPDFSLDDSKDELAIELSEKELHPTKCINDLNFHVESDKLSLQDATPFCTTPSSPLSSTTYHPTMTIKESELSNLSPKSLVGDFPNPPPHPTNKVQPNFKLEPQKILADTLSEDKKGILETVELLTSKALLNHHNSEKISLINNSIISRNEIVSHLETIRTAIPTELVDKKKELKVESVIIDKVTVPVVKEPPSLPLQNNEVPSLATTAKPLEPSSPKHVKTEPQDNPPSNHSEAPITSSSKTIPPSLPCKEPDSTCSPQPQTKEKPQEVEKPQPPSESSILPDSNALPCESSETTSSEKASRELVPKVEVKKEVSTSSTEVVKLAGDLEETSLVIKPDNQTKAKILPLSSAVMETSTSLLTVKPPGKCRVITPSEFPTTSSTNKVRFYFKNNPASKAMPIKLVTLPGGSSGLSVPNSTPVRFVVSKLTNPSDKGRTATVVVKSMMVNPPIRLVSPPVSVVTCNTTVPTEGKGPPPPPPLPPEVITIKEEVVETASKQESSSVPEAENSCDNKVEGDKENAQPMPDKPPLATEVVSTTQEEPVAVADSPSKKSDIIRPPTDKPEEGEPETGEGELITPTLDNHTTSMTLVHSKPTKRKSSENAAELIKACMGMEEKKGIVSYTPLQNTKQKSIEEEPHEVNNMAEQSHAILKNLKVVKKDESSPVQNNNQGMDSLSEDDLTLSELMEASKPKLRVKGFVRSIFKEDQLLVTNNTNSRTKRKRSGSTELKKNDEVKIGFRYPREGKKTQTVGNDISLKRTSSNTSSEKSKRSPSHDSLEPPTPKRRQRSLAKDGHR